MNSMMAAIKAKRGGKPNESYEEVEVEEKPMMSSEKPEKGIDLNGLVSSLDEAQKQELLSLLTEQAEGEGEDVEKGGASPNEKKIIAQKASEEEEGLSEDESDSIAMSMVDRQAERMNDSGAKPRNLSERAKMYMAKNLKQKGKM